MPLLGPSELKQWTPPSGTDVREELEAEIKEQAKWLPRAKTGQWPPVPRAETVYGSVHRSLTTLERHVRQGVRGRGREGD